jgi:Rad3-related DNA helicase
MLLPAHEFVVFDEAHEILDIFATLLGTSLNASRLRAIAAVARPLLGPEFVQRCADLVDVAERFAASLQAQFDRDELVGPT